MIERAKEDHPSDDSVEAAASAPLPQVGGSFDSSASTRDASVERVRALVKEHHAFVWRTVRRLGLPEDAADDAAQQVFVVLARRIDEVARGAEKSFLYRTAANVTADMRRRYAVRRRVEAPTEEGTAPEVADSAESAEERLDRAAARALLAEAIESLPDDVREVFVLFELEGLTSPEIATLTGVPEGTVASRLRRAREKFMEIIKRLKARRADRGGRP